MVRVLVLVFVCVMAAGCQNRTVSERAGEAPVFETGNTIRDPYEFDFGTISDREPVSHVFTLENKSARPMKITGKTNSCGCISSEIDRDTIPPGEQAQVKVTFNPAAYGGMAVVQYVYVNTDDPENPVYRFLIKAQVK